jgi:hypothetical protein
MFSLDLTPKFQGHSLCLALVLFLLFASVVAATQFPLQPLDPAWQLRFTGTLVNGAPFPLLGPVDIAQPLPLLKAQVGFAALAHRRRGSPRTLLQELQRAWNRSRASSS